MKTLLIRYAQMATIKFGQKKNIYTFLNYEQYPCVSLKAIRWLIPVGTELPSYGNPLHMIFITRNATILVAVRYHAISVSVYYRVDEYAHGWGSKAAFDTRKRKVYFFDEFREVLLRFGFSPDRNAKLFNYILHNLNFNRVYKNSECVADVDYTRVIKNLNSRLYKELKYRKY